MTHARSVQWSEDGIEAQPVFWRSWVRSGTPSWVSTAIARDHLTQHRRRPCEVHAAV